MSEWKTDENGKRFRKVGNCIEYEPTIWIGGREVPQSEVSAVWAAIKAEEEKELEEQNKRRKEEVSKPQFNCPFSKALNNRCKREACKLYLTGECAIKAIASGCEAPQAAESKAMQYCPFTSSIKSCSNCALYDSGCAFVKIATACINKI